MRRGIGTDRPALSEPTTYRGLGAKENARLTRTQPHPSLKGYRDGSNREPRLDEADLEKRILRGLALEWEEARWILPPDLRERMRLPLFTLKSMKNRLGTWDRNKREIALSLDLVFRHSWDSAREVLRHEMAHQLAQEVLGGLEETPHGPAFQEACRLLGADPRASAELRPLDQACLAEDRSDGDRKIERARKLLALAQSPNRHEAEAAMAKAHEIILKYNLELVEARGPREYVSLFVLPPLLRHPLEHYHLAGLLQDFYFVRCVWSRAFVLEKARMGRALEVTGTVQNVRLASYVSDFVRGFIDREWTRYNRDRGLDRHRKSDFAIGIVKGFRSRLEKQDGSRVPNAEARKASLVLIRDPQLEEHLARRYPRLVSVRRRGGTCDPAVLRAGVQAGKRLVLHKPIETRGPSGGLLPPSRSREDSW